MMKTTLSVGTIEASIQVDLPVKIESEMNRRDHGVNRNKRFKAQKEAVYYTLLPFRPTLAIIAKGEAIAVTFTRLGPRQLDDDNLASGFKACRDQVATMLGINDGSKRIKFEYAQEKSRTYSARVAIVRRTA